ncbi:MAG: GntR family transcriptional regulator [Lentisphaeria bacterium]|nr:GntR family transcriptional regulator [Lentisphaeria bacterium]
MPGYKKIADMLTQEIAVGNLAPGSALPSLHHICRNFKVSYLTAFRVHEELERRGLIIRNPAFRKTLVGAPLPLQKNIPPKLKKIVLLHSVYPVDRLKGVYGKHHFLMTDTLKRLCEKNGFEFSSEFNQEISPSRIPGAIKQIDRETGYILSGHSASSIHLSALILNDKFISKVLMDHLAPGCGCVVNDYGSGMKKIVEELKERGIREVLYLRKSFALGNYYAHVKFKSALDACSQCGIRFRSLESPDFGPALDFITRNVKRKAVMTPQDTVADRFRMFLEKQHVPESKMPLITGSDNISFAEKKWPKMTLKHDVVRQVSAAFDMLIHSPACPVIPDIEEIPVRLILPEEWEAEDRNDE